MSKFRVLLVDDEQDFLAVMGRRIESWGPGLRRDRKRWT
jgi:CheY-like chemotaxis protein